LGNPELKLDISQLSPLLEKDMLAAVTDVFINERKQKFTEWIPNIISSEVKVCYMQSFKERSGLFVRRCALLVFIIILLSWQYDIY